MNNHPNRNWRRRAINAYHRFRRDQAGRNYPAPDTVDDKIQRAYMTGYNDGRNDAKSRAPEHQLLPATNDFRR